MKDLSAKEKYRLFILDTVSLLYLSLDLRTKKYSLEEIDFELKRINNKNFSNKILLDINKQIEIDFKLS